MGRESGTGSENVWILVGADAEIDLGEIPEAVNGEAGAGEQRERQSEFSDDKQPAHALTARTGAGTSALFQSFGRIDARGIPCGSAAKKQTGERGRSQREQQDGKIEP